MDNSVGCSHLQRYKASTGVVLLFLDLGYVMRSSKGVKYPLSHAKILLQLVLFMFKT